MTTLQALRYELAHPRTSVQLCVLGIMGGVSAAGLIILFRLGLEWVQLHYLATIGEFNTLAWYYRLLLPVGAAMCIVIVAWITGFRHYRMGIPFVIHRVKRHYGVIPFRTTINQFFGGMLALAGGFVVGREGPSVHIGAAGSSILGEWLKLPYNSIRILAGCGIAAGISASFNTPFAAVIFVMEVVLREYKIHIFVPVMLAAACGSLLTRWVFGAGHELSVVEFNHVGGWIYLYLVLVGIMLGALAALFNNQLMRVMRWFRPVSMVNRLLLAGLVTGLFGAVLPHAMGANFDALYAFFDLQPSLFLLLAVLASKLVLAVFAIALGVPGGIIGAVMVIGMLFGVLLLTPLSAFTDTAELTDNFALLGLAGMLTAVLHAPLAALSSVMELSFSPGVILPAMLVIVPAYVTSTQLLGNRSIFIRQLDYQKLRYTTSSVQETLQKTGVLACMDSEFKQYKSAPESAILAFLEKSPTHPVVQQLTFEIDVHYQLVQYDVSLGHETAPLRFYDMEGIHSQATLAEVYEILSKRREGGVYVYDTVPENIVGVITWNYLHSYLMREQF
ncbi:chloride channel protein [Aestuariibacter salexigens]|uniref:chloride channel protein n=1 Tax=Aestuariibacter salexigens TaxID=226010 RepID=UPI00047B86B7|nr:chloride channel protein [Aestuariibacter salexigens]